MVNESRLTKEFIALASLDSPSFHERKVADAIIATVHAMGFEVYEDQGGLIYGGDTGNLYFTLQGDPAIPSLLLMAHMDTVVPCIGKHIIVEGDIIRSDGSTILGGDDVAGIVEILETLRVVQENNIPHGPVEVVLTFGEEQSLCGAKVLEFDRIKSKLALVLDNHGVGKAAISGPSQYQLFATFHGKSAHAGVEPEKGLSAIVVAAKAISQMKLGRLDFETTANAGVIKGGEATNIVCDCCSVHFEARSRNMEKLEAQVAHMKAVMEAAAAQAGATVTIKQEFLYPAFKIPEDDSFIKLFQTCCKKVGLEPVLEATGGGSDTNIISGKGIKAIDLSCGMTDVHTLNESIRISDMVQGTALLVAMIQEMKETGGRNL
ncbi:MAG: M20/M25/M40 family metallo-hydrolase [Clostridia bacterium]